MAKEKRINYNTGYLNGEVVDIKNGKILNKGKSKEALKFTIEIDTGNGANLDVDFFVNKYTSDGSGNKTYTKMKKLYTEVPTRADNGEGGIVNCLINFNENNYITKDGEIIKGNIINQGIFCTTESDSKFPITKGAKAMVYGMFLGATEIEDVNGECLEIKLLVNNYAYVDKEGETKVDGFIMTIRTHNQEYAEYIKEEIKEGDIVYTECDLIKVVKNKKTRGIGKSVKTRAIVEKYMELTNMSAPIAKPNEEGIYEKCIYDDLEEGEEEELCYTVFDREDFPFTKEYIDLMFESIEEKNKKLEAKAEEIKNSSGVEQTTEADDEENEEDEEAIF